MSRGGHVEPMDEETKRLYDLVHYSGITMDPNLFVNITDLLKEDVHPDAIVKVLKDAAVSSPYNDPEKQKKIKRKSALTTRQKSPGPPKPLSSQSRRTLSPTRERTLKSSRRSMINLTSSTTTTSSRSSSDLRGPIS